MKSFWQREKYLLLAIGLHLTITLPLAWSLNLWLDEAWTLQTTNGSLAFVWKEAIQGERQAPLYFLILTVWRFLNDSLFFARLFSIFCTAGAILIFAKVIRDFLPDVWQKVLIFLFALHPFLIWAATEARSYALVILLSGWLVWLWQEGYVKAENKKKQAAFLVLCVVSLYTNYYLGFLLVGFAAALTAFHRWSALKWYLLQMGIVAVAILPLISIVSQQFRVNADYYRAPTSFLEVLLFTWWNIHYLVLPIGDERLAPVRTWFVRIVIAALVILWFQNRQNETGNRMLALMALASVIIAFYIAVYFLVGESYVSMRHLAGLFLPLLLLFAAVLAAVPPRRVWLPTTTLLLFLFATNLYQEYAPLAKFGDWERTAKFLQINEQADEPIAVFMAYDQMPLRFYYNGVNEIIPAPVEHDWNPEAAKGTTERWRRQINFITEQIPVERRRIWLVTDNICGSPSEPQTSIECQPLEDFVNTHYVVERSEYFFKRKVRLLKRRDN